jgi:hypothetical protein
MMKTEAFLRWKVALHRQEILVFEVSDDTCIISRIRFPWLARQPYVSSMERQTPNATPFRGTPVLYT